MIPQFEIPIQYVHKYASNETTSSEIQKFIEDMIADWTDEDCDVYNHYAELEEINRKNYGDWEVDT